MRDKIDDNLYIRFRNMNGIVELQYMAKRNNVCPIKVLDGNCYLVKSTGEVRFFDKTGTNRSHSYKSLYRTFKKLRYLINNNFFGDKNELFVTLTYGGNDRPLISNGSKKFYTDFKIYIRSLRRVYGDIEFINVVEPHEDGHLHAHVLLKFMGQKSVFIDNDTEMECKFWKHGWTSTRSLVGVTNIGAYLSAYLSDLEVSDLAVNDCLERGERIRIKEIEGKRYIKGGRLKYYPKNFRIYRRSKGILEPTFVEGVSGDIKKKIGILGREPDFSKRYDVVNSDFNNIIIYEHFNLR